MKENGDEANDDAFDAFLRWCRANAIEVREDDVEFTFAVQKANKDRGVTAKRALERGAILAVILIFVLDDIFKSFCIGK